MEPGPGLVFRITLGPVEDFAVNEDQFKKQLHERGYGEARVKDYAPNTNGPMHTHDASVMGLITEGEFTLALEDGSRTYSPGEWFELPAGTLHTERTGSGTATVMLALK